MSQPISGGSQSKESFVPNELANTGPTPLADLLQSFCLSRRSGQITFRSEESFGFLYLLHGRVLHAICGAIEGEDAIYRMLSWPPGEFSIDEDILPREHSVILTWEQLLLEGARRSDQGMMDTTLRPVESPVVTHIPSTSTRSTKASLPRLSMILPDERPRVCQLEVEYTHVGRASGNEIPLADPSVSNRHCVLILHGSDVIVRDLNSSNGTLVNGQAVSEAILQPGDVIQVGIVQMKFEPGVRRPKLTQTAPSGYGQSELSQIAKTTVPALNTVKLPEVPDASRPEVVKDDSVFVKGQSPISYDNLAKPEEPTKGHPLVLFAIVSAVVIFLLGAGYYYFFLVPH
jgi:pSer/pThr/pTyr-binding forkhead associated (FHA) protein